MSAHFCEDCGRETGQCGCMTLRGPHRLCEHCGCGVMHCGCEGQRIMREIGAPAFAPAWDRGDPLYDGAMRAVGLSWIDRQRVLIFEGDKDQWLACLPNQEGILAPLVPLGLADEKVIKGGSQKGKRAFALTPLGRRTLEILIAWEARLNAWDAEMDAKLDAQIAAWVEPPSSPWAVVR